MDKWTQAYNCHSRVIVPKLLTINVTWESTKDHKSGYQVSIGSRKLVNLYGDIDAAKQAGTTFAKRIFLELHKSILELEGEKHAGV